jgi:hypothetical protein
MCSGDIGERGVVGEVCNVVEKIEVYKASQQLVGALQSRLLAVLGKEPALTHHVINDH